MKEYWVMVIAHERRAVITDLQTLEIKKGPMSEPLREAWAIVNWEKEYK
jgi:hypothetical protein